MYLSYSSERLERWILSKFYRNHFFHENTKICMSVSRNKWLSKIDVKFYILFSAIKIKLRVNIEHLSRKNNVE